MAAGGPSQSNATGARPQGGIGNPATAFARLQEPGSDALKFGTVPAYTELQMAAIRGESSTVTFTLTLAAALPQRMPDAQTTMRTGFRVKVGDVPYVLGANASSSGWAGSATKNGTAVAFPGTLQEKSNTLTIVVPWSFLGGPQGFLWTAFAAWEQAAAVKSYSVDIIPNAGQASFPQG